MEEKRKFFNYAGFSSNIVGVLDNGERNQAKTCGEKRA